MELAIPITILIKDSLEMGLVQTLWEITKICPIFKKRNKFDPLNYRSTSLTSIICKICETIIRNKMIVHLEWNSILSNEQHGFRSKHSTVTNLLEYMEHMTKVIGI